MLNGLKHVANSTVAVSELNIDSSFQVRSLHITALKIKGTGHISKQPRRRKSKITMCLTIVSAGASPEIPRL
jgi:hypothetical protein